MSKKLSIREKNRRMFLKMHRSFGNKMHGENLIWWNSLSKKAQYSILFRWIPYKKFYKFKRFIEAYKPGYKPTTVNYREAIIDHIINSKIKT